MTDLQGWQKVAREIGDYDLSDACDGYSGSGCPTNLRLVGDRETVGDWLPAEAAAKEILRLRERVAAVTAHRDDLLVLCARDRKLMEDAGIRESSMADAILKLTEQRDKALKRVAVLESRIEEARWPCESCGSTSEVLTGDDVDLCLPCVEQLTKEAQQGDGDAGIQEG